MSELSQKSRDLPVERRVTGELTEVRTVHSRAVSALQRLEHIAERQSEAGGVDSYYGTPDPNVAEIHAALMAVVRITKKFKRVGR